MKKIVTLLTVTTLALYGQIFNVSTTPELRTALETAATNGEDDTVILADGTYKTTDDGQGTFIYLSNEDNNLTLQGSDSTNVTLSGDNIEQILNHQSTESAPMTLEKLSFLDGNASNTNSRGGAFETDYNVEILDCNISYNTDTAAGAFTVSGSITIKNSVITFNRATNNGSGGGFSAFTPIEPLYVTIVSTVFSNNSADGYGGGFNLNSNSGTIIVSIEDSLFKNNKGLRYEGGGGFYISGWPSSLNISNSTFSDNVSVKNGGGFNALGANITNSIFTNNSASNNGGGLYGASNITNSIFTNNSASNNGGGLYGTSNITNSIFTNNSATLGGGFCGNGKAINSIFAKNSSGIYLSSGEENDIYNSIFIDNNTSDINGSSNIIIANLENNYLDTSKLTVSNFKKNNIFSGVTLSFIDEANGNYNLTASSDLINAGNTNITGVTLPTTDLNSNTRISGSTIDIGPYEFSTTKPTITSITYTGTATEQFELTFTTNYTLTDTRSITSVEYDYTDDSSWTGTDTHTFISSGTYKVNVKVTDSTGEFSVGSLSVTVATLAYADMTDEQKLVKAIDSTYYDSIVAIITSKEDSARDSGVTTGENNVVLQPSNYSLYTALDLNNSYESGKHYIQANLEEYNLVTLANMEQAIADTNTTVTASGVVSGKNLVIASPSAYGLVAQADVNSSVAEALATGTVSGKQYVRDNLTEFDLVEKSTIEITSALVTNLSTGWTLVSTPFTITDLLVFDGASVVWVYNNTISSWSAYSSNATTKQKIIDNSSVSLLTSIPAGSGVWVQK